MFLFPSFFFFFFTLLSSYFGKQAKKQVATRHVTSHLEMASDPQVILVFGATGRQGGSVVDELLRRGPTKFRVRAATRDVTAEKARQLASRGVDVVRVDLTKLIENEDDHDYRLAVRGCYGLFLMTDYWTPGVGGHETTIGSRAAKIAKEEGVQHIIWSTLPDPAGLSSGRLEVPHFADKALVDKTIKELQFKHHSFILIGFYYQNFAAGYSKPKIKVLSIVQYFDQHLTANGYIARRHGCLHVGQLGR